MIIETEWLSKHEAGNLRILSALAHLREKERGRRGVVGAPPGFVCDCGDLAEGDVADEEGGDDVGVLVALVEDFCSAGGRVLRG